jgi:hypothetical protein
LFESTKNQDYCFWEKGLSYFALSKEIRTIKAASLATEFLIQIFWLVVVYINTY